MELAQAMEAEEKSVRSFKRTESAIRKVQGRPTRHAQVKQPCPRRGRPGHNAQDCMFKDAECHACGKKGHVASACKSKAQAKPQRIHSLLSTAKPNLKIHMLYAERNKSQRIQTPKLRNFHFSSSNNRLQTQLKFRL